MATTLTVRDESLSGETLHEFSLDFLTEHITVRELIRSRVYQEVKDFNAQQGSRQDFRGLVQPASEPGEKRSKKHAPIDWNQQFDKALEAFEANQILILVGDRQVESLDEDIEVTTTTNVSFLRLTMLVGG